jgi:HD-GYP domain-containing protein (c-di-GMP phosphodiesterase class II)
VPTFRYSLQQRTNVELQIAYDTTLEGWSKALDLRDKETEGHTLRVTEATIDLARAVNVAKDDLIHIRRGSLLHDIRKMGIPDSVLPKPGPLNEDEWVVMKRHPTYAYELLSPIPFCEARWIFPTVITSDGTAPAIPAG